jgi:hypothetical protein
MEQTTGAGWDEEAAKMSERQMWSNNFDRIKSNIRRLVTIWGEKVLMAVVVTAAVIGLTRFASHVSRSSRGLETKNVRDADAVFRVEVRYLWLPEALARLAKRQAQTPLFRDHDEFKQFLELENLEDLCYGLTVRVHRVNGEFDDVTYIRHPYAEIDRFPELMDVMATVAGSPPPRTGEFEYDFSTASVQVVSQAFGERALRQFIDEQLSRLSLPADQKHDP